MDGGELQEEDGRFRKSPKFPVWIIEHIWAHRMMDIQEVVDPSSWPDVDSQPLILKDSWRLRVASAQVYSIVKNRDTKNYERAVGFLDATYRLLPRLVRAIKHMKIMFGLKTTVIMWMLKEGKGVIDIVSKIGHFFPNKLPQYQDQCSRHEMFLMRKNHADFKSFAQTLALNKNRLEEYMENQMEEQYGEHYAQKVEERLLHYLQELESALPGDTYIDKILKKHSPVTEEEKLLLDVITSDSTTIAATLRKLLRCDVATCRPEVEVSQPSLYESPAESGEIQQEVFRGPSEHSPLLLDNEDSSDVRESQQPEDEAVGTAEDGRHEEEEELSQRSRGGGKEVSSSPQFCSRHQRWVKNILRGCGDDCSEELLRQTTVSSSPVLFQSSSSTSSSQDLTPSDLVPSPAHQPLSQTSAGSQASNTTNTGEKSSSGSPETNDPSQREPPTKNTPPLLSPVVRLVDITSFWRRHQHVSSNHVTVFIPEQTSPLSLRCESGNKDSVFILPDVQTSSVTQDVPERGSRQPPTRQTWSKLSRKFRRARASSGASQDLTNKSAAERFVTIGASLPTSCAASAESPQHVDHQHSDRPHRPEAHVKPTSRLPVSWNPPGASSSSPQPYVRLTAESPQHVDHQHSDKPHPPEAHVKPTSRLPVSSSSSPQPYVRLTRLSAQECRRATRGKASTGRDEADERTEETQDTDSSFDVNILYSGGSSSSDWEDWTDPDPDYRPHIKKRRLLLEYESAQTLKQTRERGNKFTVI